MTYQQIIDIIQREADSVTVGKKGTKAYINVEQVAGAIYDEMHKPVPKADFEEEEEEHDKPYNNPAY